MRLTAGVRLGPYEIIAPLGAGAMGEVYRARDERLSRDSLPLAGATLVALVALVVAGLAVAGRFHRQPVPRSPIRSLAVLPVANYSEKPGEGYFADSMTEAMIADLARISSVTVTSRTSVMRYKDTARTTREIARELGVDGVIEASFIKAGNQVVITATLIDGRTDTRIWSQRYEREMQEVLAMQSQVARAISKEISATLTPQAQKYLDEARAVDPAAHDAYLRGQYELNRTATLKWLEKGRRDRADCIPWVAVDPKLDLLHGDQGFQDLLWPCGNSARTLEPAR